MQRVSARGACLAGSSSTSVITCAPTKAREAWNIRSLNKSTCPKLFYEQVKIVLLLILGVDPLVCVNEASKSVNVNVVFYVGETSRPPPLSWYNKALQGHDSGVQQTAPAGPCALQIHLT